jgi:dTDP-3-amino-2,3,6-trideoxy-4-keto-D-glucose/dTDP-3-amino-3,4,6-trideoxy-alpha-D-glucose/dTDP-2,6-dideoxy-D-kanosamine transaminase
MIKTWSYIEEYKVYRKKILNSIDKTLKSGNLFFGKQLNDFEKNFLKLNRSKFGVAVGTGTDALIISLKVLGIGNNSNDEVITVSNTAIPTVSAIKSAGAKAVFIDIGNDYLIDVNKIEKRITKNTKAIIPVHLYGQACDMKKILFIAKKYNLKIIEDCAQAQGAKFNNKYVGTFGDLGCFSFYPTKILGAYGDGGFITTNSQKLFQKIRRARFYGIEQFDKKSKFYKKYYANEHGLNSRLDEIHASILNIKLKDVKKNIKKRKKLAKIYEMELKNTSLTLPIVKKNCEHVFHLYSLYHSKRDLIIKKLKEKKIEIKIYYPAPIHLMKAYKNFSNRKNLNLKITEKVSKGIFSLPLYPNLKYKQAYKITKILKNILKNL